MKQAYLGLTMMLLSVTDGLNIRKVGTRFHLQARHSTIASQSTAITYPSHDCESVPGLSTRRAVVGIMIAGSSYVMFSTPARAADNSVFQDIESARKTLQVLLNNWERAVIDCTYADVPRELLEQRNKELLLEKASTFALFDKSVSVISCKTTNRIVRDYIGATNKGPLVGLEKKLQQGLELVEDADNVEEYVATIETLQQNLAKARSLSYAAGVADFNSVNNFAEAEKNLVLMSPNSNLEQTRQTIVSVVKDLEKVLKLVSQSA